MNGSCIPYRTSSEQCEMSGKEEKSLETYHGKLGYKCKQFFNELLKIRHVYLNPKTDKWIVWTCIGPAVVYEIGGKRQLKTCNLHDCISLPGHSKLKFASRIVFILLIRDVNGHEGASYFQLVNY